MAEKVLTFHLFSRVEITEKVLINAKEDMRSFNAWTLAWAAGGLRNYFRIHQEPEKAPDLARPLQALLDGAGYYTIGSLGNARF